MDRDVYHDRSLMHYHRARYLFFVAKRQGVDPFWKPAEINGSVLPIIPEASVYDTPEVISELYSSHRK